MLVDAELVVQRAVVGVRLLRDKAIEVVDRGVGDRGVVVRWGFKRKASISSRRIVSADGITAVIEEHHEGARDAVVVDVLYGALCAGGRRWNGWKH